MNQGALSDLKKWHAKSVQYLSDSKQVATITADILKQLKDILDNNNVLILRINFLIGYLNDQIELMNQIFKGLKEVNKKFQDKFVKGLNYLNELINQLNEELTKLNNIKIEESIVGMFSGETKLQNDGGKVRSGAGLSLYSLLSLEEFLKHQQNLEIFNENFNDFNNYLKNNQINFFEINLINFNNYFQNLLNQYNNIIKYFYNDLTELNLYGNDNKLPINSNEKYSLLISYYENEMTSLLTSLTHHYDQCNESIALFNNKQYSQLNSLVPILANDSLEAPNVVKDIELLYMKIHKIFVSSNLTNLMTNLTSIYNDLIVNNFIIGDFLKKTNHDLQIESNLNQLNQLNFNFLKHYLNIQDDQDIVNLNLKDNIDEIKNYLVFLSSFKLSYFKLILEVDRKAQMNQKIRKLIGSFVRKLNEIEGEELQNNGSFERYLPSDVYKILNGKDKKKVPNVEIISQFEELPELNEETLAEAKEVVKLAESSSDSQQ